MGRNEVVAAPAIPHREGTVPKESMHLPQRHIGRGLVAVRADPVPVERRGMRRMEHFLLLNRRPRRILRDCPRAVVHFDREPPIPPGNLFRGRFLRHRGAS
jgi:hypothetical protein